jgi:hypothetical protein
LFIASQPLVAAAFAAGALGVNDRSPTIAMAIAARRLKNKRNFFGEFNFII